MISANKGEWSELYVLFKLLGEKKLYAGDGNLNKLETFYPVLKILRDELERHLEYTLDKEIVIVTENKEEISRISVTDFLQKSKELFEQINNGGDGTGAFEITNLNDFLKKIHCQKVKAKSLDKADIHIVIHDYHTGMEPNLGFSIKSEAGSKATLLNASSATIFNYLLKGRHIDENTISEINNISTRRKIQDRVVAISKAGASLEMYQMPNNTFFNNLTMIDSHLPKIIAWMMADCYKNRDMDIQKAVERIKKANPMNYDMTGGHDFYGYKIKSLLVNVALGMLPATVWNGKYEATGGYILVKDDGDVICFHIYDRNLLEDYLFHNTKFESPKSDINNPIICKGDNACNYFTLCLQIRFK